jgi:hypothetical protein
MEHRIHEVSRAVSSEWAAGSICAVGAWSEPEDENASTRIAESGDGTRPVDMILIGAAAGLADADAVLAKAGTELAGGDQIADQREIWSGNGKPGQSLVQRYLQSKALAIQPAGSKTWARDELIQPPHR